MARVYNFSAGPSVLPLPVLQKAQADLVEYKDSGQSVMEMSHRSKNFEAIIADTEARLRRVLAIPANYKVAFIQGGATLQFAMVPLNLMGTGQADYWVTGNFSGLAAKEAEKFGKVNIVASSAEANFTYIPNPADVPESPDASYVHICQNNTIFGTRFTQLPKTKAPLVADLSSCILSEPIDVSQYGVIYFGVQKNVAPAGMAVAIIREDLLGNAPANTPALLNYKTIVDADSMYNTPPTWCIYMMGLTLQWIEEEIGGLANMQKLNQEKAAVLYDYLDSQSFYKAPVQKEFRSLMNVTFTAPTKELDAAFCEGAAKEGLVNIKGHRLVGGMRASIYNAMPKAGVTALVAYMQKFAAQNGG
ncbi:3-phosphoserine/phosphohydroxythreonine transaminase [Ruminococcaceae bacterium OttesenSCG-928-A16]|nr:3-phosphoserine/phosphohydroxythreonine transaminase [Ruminococcaceae bacterium OttesenSCG-928-A16]